MSGSFEVDGRETAKEKEKATETNGRRAVLAVPTSLPLGGGSLNIGNGSIVVSFNADDRRCSLVCMRDGAKKSSGSGVASAGCLSFRCISAAETEQWGVAMTEHATTATHRMLQRGS